VNLTDRAAITFGYRWLDIDYESCDGIERFAYDVLMQGPVVGFVFRF